LGRRIGNLQVCPTLRPRRDADSRYARSGTTAGSIETHRRYTGTAYVFFCTVIYTDIIEERLLNLERDHVRMLNALEEQGIAIPMASSADGDVMHGISPRQGQSAGGGRWREFDDGNEAVRYHPCNS
jgi:hypothetical protein